MLEQWHVFLADPGAYFAQAGPQCTSSGPASYRLLLDMAHPFAFTPVTVTSPWFDAWHEDVWLGVVNTSSRPSQFTLRVAHSTHSFTVAPRGSRLLLADGDNAVPALAVAHPYFVSLTSTVLPYVLVGAKLGDRARRALASGRWLVAGTAVSDGWWDAPASSGWAEGAASLPGYGEVWRAAAARKREWLAVVLEELMATACHPSRLAQIGV